MIRLKQIASDICSGKATAEEEGYVRYMYQKAFGVAFSSCKCQLCDAIFKIIKKLENMSIFRLKKGVCLRIKYGDPRVFTASSITDELAIEHLKNNPSEAKFYEFIPPQYDPTRKIVQRVISESHEVNIEVESNAIIKTYPAKKRKR